MLPHLWAVSVTWSYRRKTYSATLDVIAYTLTEAAEVAETSMTRGIHSNDGYCPGSQLRHIRITGVKQRCSIDAMAPLRPLPSPPAHVSDLDLSTRALNALEALSIDTVAKLCATSRSQLKSVKSAGDGTANEIEAELAYYGLSLAADAPNEHDDDDSEGEHD